MADAAYREPMVHIVLEAIEDPVADLIFVHGLGGDAVGTWSLGDTPSWGEWLRSDFRKVAIWSLDYPASPTDWRGHTMPLPDRAVNVLSLLHASGLGTRPLIFIAHSLGGLLVKQMLRVASDRHLEIRHNVVGVVFLSTPHSGSLMASLVGLVKLLAPSDSIGDLEAHSPALRDLNQWFRDHHQGINISVLYEARDTHGIRVVDPTSADPGITGVRPVPVDHDHFSICKPRSRDGNIYSMIRQFVHSTLSATGISLSPLSMSVTPLPRLADSALTYPEKKLTMRKWTRGKAAVPIFAVLACLVLVIVLGVREFNKAPGEGLTPRKDRPDPGPVAATEQSPAEGKGEEGGIYGEGERTHVLFGGLVALVPETTALGANHITALMLDARTGTRRNCSSPYRPLLKLETSPSECLEAGCTLMSRGGRGEGVLCTCSLDRQDVSIDPDVDPPLQILRREPPNIFPAQATAGDFSYIINLSRPPLDQVIDPKYLGSWPPQKLLARMRVPFESITACNLSSSKDVPGRVLAMDFRKQNLRLAREDDVRQAVAEEAVVSFRPAYPLVTVTIRDFGGDNPRSMTVRRGPIFFLNEQEQFLPPGADCATDISMDFALFYELSLNPPAWEDRLIPHLRQDLVSDNNFDAPVCSRFKFRFQHHPVTPLAVFDR